MTEAQTYSFFLGCVMPNRFPNVEKSIREVLPRLGIELEDLEGASCCPAPGVIRSFSEPTWLALASRNLALAEKAGHDLITGCNGCYGTFKEALATLHENPERLTEVQKVFKGLGIKFTGNVDAKHLIEVIYALGPEEIKKRVTRPLTGLRVAVHYGCHLLKPSKNRPWKKTERHTFLDELVEATGAESIRYRDKYMCCGAGGGVRGSNVPVSIDIAREKLDNMLEAGADVLVDVCSFCHLQFEISQPQLNKELGENRYQLPVMYYTQLLGLAMGLEPDQLGLNKHVVSTKALLDRILG
ncbi:MAG: CoB--CoM heterodisulfide reductase subunit B [Candidatus Thorarchaeota archaeon]|nr:MAG: CoB--CoM heterodisulfide reductase subunit B [Candidatus Thorarchaeota archaeon]